MSPPLPVDRCDRERSCVTCSGEAVPMRVTEIGPAEGLAICADAEGRRSEVMTGLVGQVAIGDALLVHAGAALLRIDETEDVIR